MTPLFGATLGSVKEAGERLAVCALEAGAGSQTKIHGVGDGAVWIIEQMEAQFGTQAKYLVDFYHLCDYLAAAGEVMAGNDPPAWMKEKMDWLKDNRWKDVLEALRPSLEPANIPDPEAPVRACFRYLSNHSDFLDYKGALAVGLPIGSGEIESGHRLSSLCVSEPAQDRRQLVEDRKSTKDDCSTSPASEQRLGRLLEQCASGSCIMTRILNYTRYTPHSARSATLRVNLGFRYARCVTELA